ncbi:MAG: TrmH family RNA methyltransferase [Bdellovibrionota bacterium]
MTSLLTPKQLVYPYRVVLVSPQHAGNVGAVARVAANFDCRDVWIVKPLCGWKGREAQTFAKGAAREVLSSMQETELLKTALSGCVAAVGFTRRSGELRQSTIRLGEVQNLASHGKKIALVFGREDGGLTHEELLQCTHVCSFEVSVTMPSINLSHAVAIALARVFESSSLLNGEQEPKAVRAQAEVSELEDLFGHLRTLMVDVGITRAGNPDRMLAHLRRALQRANLNTREVGLFRGIFSKIQVALGTRIRRSVDTSRDKK